MTMEGTADADGQNLKGKGYMDHFKLHAVSLNKPPLLIELNGLTVKPVTWTKANLASSLARTSWV